MRLNIKEEMPTKTTESTTVMIIVIVKTQSLLMKAANIGISITFCPANQTTSTAVSTTCVASSPRVARLPAGEPPLERGPGNDLAQCACVCV